MLEKTEIKVKAGNGGSGAVSFRREKFVPRGGPDGGDGGRGGKVILIADSSMTDLGHLTPGRMFKAANAKAGGTSGKHGKDAKELVLKVPPGTVVKDLQSGKVVADLEGDGEEVVVAKGGKGGWGNRHYASSTNQAPRIAQKGEEGEEKTLDLELRLIADVGIIGKPNAGKSTLLSTATAAKPKIAEYPFTTIEPVLGVVTVGEQCFVMAEIPGLIEGAHLGRGLGHEFLRHVLRTRVLIHLIDGRSETPVEDMICVNNELAMYNLELAKKPQIVTVNKVDLPEVKARVPELKREFKEAGIEVEVISAATGAGIAKLMESAMEAIAKAKSLKVEGKSEPEEVFVPVQMHRKVEVRKEGGTFVVESPEMERLVAGTNISGYEGRHQLQRELNKRGLIQALEKAGAKAGDKIRCADMEWEV